ncbi:MAG: fatty acid desaturase [Myxococcota bacterium]
MQGNLKTAEERAPNARVYALAERDRRLERMVALFAIVVPTLGAIGAVVTAAVFGLSWIEVTLWAVGHALTGFGIAIGYHRLASHKSFDTTPFLTALFAVLGSMCAQGPVIWWAAVHRRHHATSERPGDPHSPYVGKDGQMTPLRGFWHAHMGWLFVHENTDWMHYVPELLKDPRMFSINQHYFSWLALGLAIPAALGGLLHQSWQGAVLGFFWGGLLRVFTTQHATWCINSVCHVFGSRPFECRDQARNNLLIVLPTMGEGWHNHHHTFPKTAINQFEWWQFDPSGLLIRALGAVGLASNIHFPSREAREQYRRELLSRSAVNEGASS